MAQRVIAGMAVALALAFSAPARADFEAGRQAFARGDYGAALREFQPAAEAGSPEAENGLAILYRYGLGVAEDDVAALRWFTRAASKGNSQAQMHLGVIYAQGQGVDPDDVEARTWLTLALMGPIDGDDRLLAQTNRDALTRRMTVDQVAESDRRVEGILRRMSPPSPPAPAVTQTAPNVPVARAPLPTAAPPPPPPAPPVVQAPVPLPRPQAPQAAAPRPAAPPQQVALTPPPAAPSAAQRTLLVPQRAIQQKGQSVGGGTIRVLLGTYHDQPTARAAWDRLLRLYPQVLSARTPAYPKADPRAPDDQRRLQAGPFANRGEAERTCTELHRRNQPCLVVGG